MIYIATDNFNDGFPLSNAYDDTIYQKANGEYYLKFRFPVDRLGVWKNLTCETVLKADDTRGLQLFKIKKINKINGYIRVYAKHISDDLNFISVDEIAVNNATGRRVMEALAGSIIEQHSFIFNSDIATMHTLNLSNTTAGKVLSKDKHSIIGQWGGELIRDNFLVDLKARAGVDTEILFMNKKNVKNLDNVVSTENLTTRLKLTVEKEHEGKKQIITATVDSPNINAYPRIYTNYLKVTNNNIETQQQLIEYGTKYFKDSLVDFPTDNLTVNVIDKNQEQVNLFDTVWFRNVDFNIDKRLKVVAYEYSPMAKRYKKISFGALKVANFGQIKSLSQLEEKIDEKIEESFVDAFKIQKNLSAFLKQDRKGIEDKLVELEEKSKGALEVKKALFEADGTIPDVVKAKILDAVEGDIGRLKTIITEAELIKAIQAKLNYAEIKNALIDKAFINQIISDEKFTQQFEDGEVTTQNIFTKLKDSIKSNISKDFITKDGVKKIVNDLTIDADGIRQITQQEITNRRDELKGKNSYLHKKYSDYADGRNMSDNSSLKYIGIYTGDKEQAPTSASEYSWTKIKGEDGERGRDGVSNYIHRKYSDNSNGANMSDDSSLKYIGIYTGSSSTPPTTASSYLWSKIKGEDGANGTPGARGLDGRTPYFHTAYSNSPTGDIDFSVTDSNGKQYIGTYSDFEVADSTDYRRYKWVKIKGENGANGRDGVDGKSYARNYLSETAEEKILTLNNNSYVTQEIFKLVENKTFRDLGFKVGDKVTFIADYEVLPNGNEKRINRLNFEWHDDTRFRVLMNFENNPTKGTYVATLTMNNDLLDCKRAIFRADNVNAKIKIANARLIQGDTVQPWSIAQEDLRGHTLTANMWFSGNYSNNSINNVKLNLVVYYDGMEVQDFTTSVHYKGGSINDWRTQNNVRVLRGGIIDYSFWNDGEKDGTPLFALATVAYKGLQIVSDARLDNVPNVEEVKETIKRFKTFESTLEGFKSVIGEIKAKEIKAIVKAPNLCTEDFSGGKTKRGNDLYFNVSPNLKANTKYTIIVRAVTKQYKEHQKTKVYGAKSGGDEQWLKSGYNVWVVDYATEQTKVNIYPLGNSVEVTKVEIYEGDYKEYIDKNNKFTSLGEITNYTSYYSYKINHNIPLAKEKVYLVQFDLATLPTQKWFSAGDGNTILEYEWDFQKLNEELKLKDNKYIFQAYNEKFYIFHSTNSLKITNVRLYEVRFGVTLATQSSLVDISSMIDQSKDSIILSTKSEINDQLRNYPNHDYLNSNFANKRDIENLASKSELKILTNKIESTVTTGNIGTLLSQNAEEIIVAWNNYNKYFSFNNETLDIYENAAYQQKYKKLSLTSEGLKIYNNNALIGTIGTFTHLGQSFRQNTFDIVLTENTKAFGIYTWTDTWAFDTHLTGYAPLFEIKLDNNGTYRSYFHQPVQTSTAYIGGLYVADSGTSYIGGITKTINVGGRNLQFVQGILVSG